MPDERNPDAGGGADDAPDLAALAHAVDQAPEDPVARARFVRAAVDAGDAEDLRRACVLAAELWIEGDGALVADGLATAWGRLALRGPQAGLAQMRTAWEAGEHEQVRRVGERLLAEPCYLPDVHVRSALSAVALGLLEEGVDGLERYVAARPDDGRGWENLIAARVLLHRSRGRREDLAASASTARLALRLHADRAPLLRNASEALRDAGAFSEALDAARAAAEQAPGDPEAAALVARVLALTADLPSNGQDPGADYALGAARLDAGDPIGAVPFLRAAFEHPGAHPAAGEALARAYLELGAARDAVLVLDRALKSQPNEPHVWGLLGLARLQMHGDRPPELVVRRARRELERAVGRAPDVAEYHLGLARCFALEGDASAERGALERGAALGSEEARRRLAALDTPAHSRPPVEP